MQRKDLAVMALYDQYKTEIQPKLMKELELKNSMAAPKVEKVVVSVGMGEAVVDKGVLEKMGKQLEIITGQKPKITKARKSEAGFKLRKGLPIGLKVTLRARRALDFLEKMIKVVLPRLRDFKGLNLASFDGQGNYNMGFEEQTAFPELSFDDIDRIRGLEVTVVTTARDDESGKKLLEGLGFLFKEKEGNG